MTRARNAFKDDRKLTYLNSDGADKALISPVSQTTLDKARAYRLTRLREQMAEHDVAGLLLYDPINIRYAFDSSNMQVWTSHNPVRYAMILAGGPAILWEFKGCEHLNEGLPGIDEIRTAVSWMFMTKGDKASAGVETWADEIADVLGQHGGGNKRFAADKLDGPGLHALQERGLTYVEGAELTERARSIKSPEEIELMRWTIRVCEAGMARIYDHSVPGLTERELWGHLHFENARSGGDWLETKLLTCGPNTNPWYKECSDRVCQPGEMISFDTDMVGPYGYCADLSRSWTCGYTPMADTQRRIYATALEQINHNLDVLKPGVSYAEFNEKSWRIPDRHVDYRYSLAVHGVGMADEWPVIPLHIDFDETAMSGFIEPGMVVCVESLVGENGSESVKLETQVLVTEIGIERLDSFPWESV
ncbi:MULTISPECIES: Xaa-Pro peptidase family protein [unclassified Ruegeria]|uniref:M24 family metallopeptidase n=1 Tax=unclassified Ruegeria TaxID=2625375 RepID=UPI001490D37A|nr:MULTISPECIES: Xaa-Pro peptidase family protein [unclassified Ruegeria]NOD88034.1 M24 family metallopeptidase [Ruegeria sp. HKCCD4318]NOE14882.1 M24 family metallopeptidase [Ruegeria sp. HKCCD4318-2]NOG11515.1 aminopeptidase P family protein [Ruegeria sp. HKCCD4315]